MARLTFERSWLRLLPPGHITALTHALASVDGESIAAYHRHVTIRADHIRITTEIICISRTVLFFIPKRDDYDDRWHESARANVAARRVKISKVARDRESNVTPLNAYHVVRPGAPRALRECERAKPATAALGRHATNDVGGQGSRRGRREPLALRKRVTCAAAMRDTRTHARHSFPPPIVHVYVHKICK